MKLPKNYFENLTASKYREYLKLLPDMKKESTKAITMVIFTLLALSFLGIFAINPTLNTIVDLKKQLADSQFVHEQLVTKMNNLSSLQQQYTLLSGSLPLVYEAIPQSASVPLLVGQIEALAQKEGITITALRVSQVQLTGAKQSESTSSSFTFSLEAEGSYDELTNFGASLAHFNRIVTIESIGITKETKRDVLILEVRGREYFKK